MSAIGTEAKWRDVRDPVAIRGEADQICSLEVLPPVTQSRHRECEMTNDGLVGNQYGISLFQQSQLAGTRIHLHLVAVRNRGGNVLVKSGEHGQICQSGALHDDWIHGIEY